MTSQTSPEAKQMPLLVTAAILFDGEKILITRRLDHSLHHGLWEFPGGKLEAGESPEDALHREIREELGVEISVQDVVAVVYYRYDWGPVLILAYRCRLLTGPLHNLGVAEHRWVSPETLADFPLLAADQPIVNRLCGLKSL